MKIILEMIIKTIMKISKFFESDIHKTINNIHKNLKYIWTELLKTKVKYMEILGI